jgi:mannosylfructose-phosphate synthase
LLLAVGSTEPNQDEIEQTNELRRIADELNISSRVIFRDYIPDAVLADHYRAADVFALSSRYEPFGMTAVEAMACGTPTVITTEGGLWELVTWGAEAVYANPFDPEAFGHAIAAVLQHPRVACQLSRGGSQKARAFFTWTGVAQQILNILQAAEKHDVHAPHRRHGDTSHALSMLHRENESAIERLIASDQDSSLASV